MKSMILVVLVLSHVVSANGPALDDHFTNGVVLDNDGIGGDWVIVQQDTPWTPHSESGTEVTVCDGALSWAICGFKNTDSFAAGQTARITLTGIEYVSGSSRADRGNGVQAAISAHFTVADYTNGASFPCGYLNDGKPALNCEINYDPNAERIGFCLRYSNMNPYSDTVYAAKAFDASTTELGPNTPLIIEMTPQPDSTCLVRFNFSYDGGKTDALSVPMSNSGTPLTDGLFLVAVGTQGVVECNGSVMYDRVEVFEKPIPPKTLWVDAANAGDPSADGSPEHPFWRIQDGINAAVSGDEVVVKDGTYTGAGNTNLNFGGRLITLRSENGRDNCIIDCQSAQAFTFQNGETEQAVVNGFTIRKGYGISGGMYITCSPTIIGCRFIGNTGMIGGGGIYLYNSHSRIRDCEFITNTSFRDGGGLYVGAGGPSIINCLFAENSAGNGGAIFAEAADLTVTGCKFLSNRSSGASSLGGGALYCSTSNIILTDCVFSGNYYLFNGGAVCCRRSSLTAIGCSFVGNHAAGDDPFNDRQGGGGLFVKELGDTQQILIKNCIFSANFAKRTGGAICCLAGSNVSITNSLFTGNISYDLFGAGGITSWDQADVAASNCTFTDNRGTYGGVWGWPAAASLSNCILWNPTSSEAYAASVLYSNVKGGYEGQGNINADPCFSVNVSGAWTADATYDPAAYTVTCTDENASWQDDELAGLFIYPGGYPNLVFPIITNTATTVTFYADAQTNLDGASAIKAGWSYYIRDYHLTPASPCIDAGDPNYVPGPNETDLDDMPRLVDGDCNDTVRVDMGTYEFSYAYMGDFDYQCDVDFEDHAILGLAWLTTPDDAEWNAVCDISVPADKFIDWRDLRVLCENWLAILGP